MQSRTANAKTTASRGGSIPPVGALFRRRPTPPKLTDAAITRTEKQLGVKLPTAYITLMRQQNGGELRLTAIKPKQRPPRSHTHRTVYQFERIVGIHSRGSDNLASYAETAHAEWGVPSPLIPFDADGHWWLCLDYRRCGPSGEPCITHFEPPGTIGERPKSCRIADSFEALLRGLTFDAGGDLLYAIDQPDLLNGALAKRLESLGCTARKSKGESTKSPPTQWQWPKFDSSFTPGKATLLLCENGNAGAWHLARPARHPLLRLDISPPDQDRCAHLIHEEFGSALSLIHAPIDRRPPRGVPLEATASKAKPRPRKKSAPVKLSPTALNAAVLAGDLSLVRRLLAEGMSPDKSYGPQSSTALETAAREGPLSIFKLLLKSAAGPPGPKLLELAVRGGDFHRTKLLLDQGVSPTTTHLGTAVRSGDARLVKLLLNHGATPNTTCLRHAAGVTRPSEIGFPDKPRPAIMKLMRKEGQSATSTKVRARFKALK